MAPSKTTITRTDTHGPAREQFLAAQELKQVALTFKRLPPVKQEALEMIFTKISRILTGSSDFEDHWEDIAGYAMRAIGK